MRKVSGRRLAITSETRARLPMNGSRSFRVSPRLSMQCSMAAIGSGGGSQEAFTVTYILCAALFADKRKRMVQHSV